MTAPRWLYLNLQHDYYYENIECSRNNTSNKSNFHTYRSTYTDANYNQHPGYGTGFSAQTQGNLMMGGYYPAQQTQESAQIEAYVRSVDPNLHRSNAGGV